MQESFSAAPIPALEASPKRVRWQSGPPRFPQTFSLKSYHADEENEETNHLLNGDSDSTATTSPTLLANAYPPQSGEETASTADSLEGKKPQGSLDPSLETLVIASEFWLVVSVEVVDPDDVKESLKLKIFTKWFMHCPDFPRLVRAGERQLKLNGALVTSEQIEGTSIATSGASERKGETCLEYWARRLEDGERLPGLAIMGAESNAFPVNPDLVFLNSVGHQEEIIPPWLRYDPASGVVSTQYAFTTCLKMSMRVDRFPYDRHLIPMKLGVRRGWNEPGVQHKWVLAQTIPQWLDAQYPEDRSIVSVKDPPDDDQFDWNLAPFPYVGQNTILYLRIARNPRHFLTTTILPMFIVVLLAQGSLFVKGDGGGDDNDTRFNACMVSLLTVAAYKSSMQSSLPKKQYMTFADWYFVMVFSFHGLFALKIIAVIHLHGSKRAGFFEYKQPASENGLVTNDDFITWMLIDDCTTWALIALWIVFHAFFAIDRCLGFSLVECIGLRKSWATLLQERIPHDSKPRWCLGVNSMLGEPKSFKCFSYCKSKFMRRVQACCCCCCCRHTRQSTTTKDTE